MLVKILNNSKPIVLRLCQHLCFITSVMALNMHVVAHNLKTDNAMTSTTIETDENNMSAALSMNSTELHENSAMNNSSYELEELHENSGLSVQIPEDSEDSTINKQVAENSQNKLICPINIRNEEFFNACLRGKKKDKEFIYQLIQDPSFDINCMINLDDDIKKTIVKKIKFDPDSDVAMLVFECCDKMSGLHIAAFMGHSKIVRLLAGNENIKINQTIDQNEGPKNQLSVLDLAAVCGDVKCIEELLCNKDIDINIKSNKDEMIPLLSSIVKDKVMAFKRFLKCYPDAVEVLNTSKTNLGLNALHLAIVHKSRRCFDVILSHHGIDTGIVTKKANSPLHVAAYEGNAYFTKQLILYGCNVNARPYGLTALEIAVKRKKKNVIDTLLLHCKEIDTTKALDIAMSMPEFRMYYFTTITKLAKHSNTDINKSTNKYGITPLMRAVLLSDLNMIRVIADNKDLDPNIAIYNGCMCTDHGSAYSLYPCKLTALQLAVIVGNLECIQKLLTLEKIEINQVTEDGRTALDMISPDTPQAITIIDLLKEAGAVKGNELTFDNTHL